MSSSTPSSQSTSNRDPEKGPDAERRSRNVAEGELHELQVNRIAAGGGCVARTADGMVVFVRHSLPGERVVARVTSRTTSYLRADAVEILEASVERVDAPCQYAGPGRCGGCDWQHIAIPQQRDLKAALVLEQLRRLAGIETEVSVEEVPGAPDGLHWRSRVRFAVSSSGRPGLRRHRSHDIEPIEICPIAAAGVNAVGVTELRWPGATEIDVLAPGPEGGGLDDGLVEVVPGRRGLRLSDLPRLTGVAPGLIVEDHVAKGDPFTTVVVRGQKFRVSARSFWQVHHHAPDVLVAAVLEALAPAPGQRVLDLFAGVGLFSAFIAKTVGATGEVIAVEQQRSACADALVNLSSLSAASVLQHRVTPELIASLDPSDLVVLDPPREGAGPALIRALIEADRPPQRIVYVSCDPASFARDLRAALDGGWRLGNLRAFDFFPMTEHVELLGVLEP